MPIAEGINATLSKMEEGMKERLTKLAKEFSSMRTGRANPLILESVKVEYYGQPVPLKQLAAVSVPEARVLEIRPWDPSSLADIDKALQKADLGAPPQNDGSAIRIVFPAMTEERRKEMVKLVKRVGEEYRVAVRNDRHDALERIRKAQKAKEITEDEVRLIEGTIQKITDTYVRKIDEQAAGKEKEVTTV